MANTFLTPKLIAREALATLRAQLVIAPLVWRDFDQDFRGAQGASVSVRVPATFIAKKFDRATGIEVQDAKEQFIDVTLDTLLDVSFAVTTEDLALEISNFRVQLLEPAMVAIAEGVESRLLGLRSDITATATIAAPAAGTTPYADALVDARKILNNAKVPFAPRAAVLTTPHAAGILKEDLFHDADKSGSDRSLRDGFIGRAFGFTTHESNFVADDPAGSVAFHRTAFALISRTLPLPRGIGAGQGDLQQHDGLGLRVVQSYDQKLKQDVISIDFLMGVKTMDKNRAVLLKDA